MKVGTVFWHRRGSSILDEFGFLYEAGFDGVEVTISEGLEREVLPFSARGYLRIESLREDVEELREASRDTGLEIHSVRGGLLWKYPLTSPNPNVRKKAEEIVCRGLRVASQLGAATLLVVPGVVSEDMPYDEAYALALSALRRLSRVAEEEDVSIGVENVGNNFLLSPLEMRDFVDGVGSEKVGVYLDVGNVLALRQAFPEHWIRILSRRIKKVHLKDYNRALKGVTYLLHGDVNWPKVIKGLKAIGYNDYLTAEISPYRLFPELFFRDLAKTIRFLTEL